MCQVPNNSRSNSRGNSQSQGAGSGDVDERYAHIKAANRKVRLLDVLRYYGIKVEKNYQHPPWSLNITCPLPSHKNARERTPSFGYNFLSDHAHCFGCGFTGRAVEFISAYEGKTRTLIAETILSRYGEDVSADDFKNYEDDITPVLLEGSKFLQALIQKHKHAPKVLQQVDKLIWWLDFYLMAKAGNKVEAKELQHRIDKVKELLSDESSYLR